jgi:hypothetical protein
VIHQSFDPARDFWQTESNNYRATTNALASVYLSPGHKNNAVDFAKHLGQQVFSESLFIAQTKVQHSMSSFLLETRFSF